MREEADNSFVAVDDGEMADVAALQLAACSREAIADAQGLDDVAHELSDGGGRHRDLL